MFLKSCYFSESKKKSKEGDIEGDNDESKREFAEKQQSDFDRLKNDEVLTLKESLGIDHMVGSQVRTYKWPLYSAYYNMY